MPYGWFGNHFLFYSVISLHAIQGNIIYEEASLARAFQLYYYSSS